MFPITVEYALRALSCLADTDPEVVVGRQLADRCGVPGSYLSKILLILKRGGLVRATRGVGGGYRLAIPSTEISLARVVKLVAPSALSSEALACGCESADEVSLRVHEKWQGRISSFAQYLERTTLAEIAQ